jgi:hypothetical protein
MPQGLAKVEAWYERMQAFGHSQRQEITQAQALETALENEPRAIPSDANGAADIGNPGFECQTA